MHGQSGAGGQRGIGWRDHQRDQGGTVTVTPVLALTPLRLAGMLAGPPLTPLNSPPGLVTVALPLLDVQVALLVTSCVLPSEKTASACICSVVPAARVALAGVTWSDCTAALPTVTVVLACRPPLLAVSVAVPLETPLARPPGLETVTWAELLLNAPVAVRSWVLPSVRTAVRCNWSVVPGARVGEAGESTSEATVAARPVRDVLPESPFCVACTAPLPAPLTVATPPGLVTLATPLPVHVTDAARSWVVPSEKTPVRGQLLRRALCKAAVLRRDHDIESPGIGDGDGHSGLHRARSGPHRGVTGGGCRRRASQDRSMVAKLLLPVLHDAVPVRSWVLP